jgi:spermidine synthase
VATGYLLIPWLPNSTTMFLTAGLLMAVAAIYFLAWERKHLPPALVTAVVAAGVGLVGLAPRPRADAERMTVLFDGNSNFGLLQVLETKDGELRYYLNDLLTQNTYEPAEKRSSSLFTYMLHGLARAYTPQVQDVLCVGIGAGIVPSRFAREGARVEAVEINPGVLPLARRYFDFESERVKVFIGDGRQFVNQTTQLYDTIILDAFLGESPPSHLMTREAFQAFGRRLKPTGTLVINTFGDFDPRRDFLVCSLAKTLRAAFPSVRLHASGNGNVFFVASLRDQLELVNPIDLDAVTPWLRDVVRETVSSAPSANPDHGLVLTDDYNPADFYDAINREELRRRLAMSYRPD